MKIFPGLAPASLALLAILGACSPQPEAANTNAPARNVSDLAIPPAEQPSDIEAAETTNETILNASSGPSDTKILGLEGLGDLRIGQPVPKGSSWAERGAQVSDACHTVTSPDYPGVNAIVTEGKVRRITAGQRSTVKLAEGIGVGATEADVKKWFAGFRAEPHKYEEAPAKYLTAPNAPNGSSALRFEIGHDGKVKMIHIGTMPVLAYVEGCA